MNLRDCFADFIKGIEDGTRTHEQAAKLAEQLDPVLMYFAMRYLREKHPASEPRSAGVVTRMIEFTSTHPQYAKKAKQGESDAMREWFDDTFNLREYFGNLDGYADLIVEKFDS